MYQNVVHGDFQQHAECVKVVDAGEREALLPLVDGLRGIESEVALHVPDADPAFFPEPDDLPSGRFQVDGRVVLHLHDATLLRSVQLSGAKMRRNAL